MVHGHGGVVIGSEMTGGVRHVVISNCVFQGTDRGIRLKSRRGRGGVVEDLRVSNVVMSDVLCPFIMNLYYGCGAWGARRISDKAPWPVDEGTQGTHPRVARRGHDAPLERARQGLQDNRPAGLTPFRRP